MASIANVLLLILCILSSVTFAQSLIRIQSTLTEIWETNSETLNYSSSTGYAVVIQGKTYDSLLGQWIPAAGSSIDVQVMSPSMEMIVQERNGLFRQTLVQGQPKSFLLNAMGRFSFFVPLSGHKSTFLAPELAVKMVDEDVW